jgi:hypothetical protein
MPFREPFNSYYPTIFKPALEDALYDVSRADDLFTPRPIMLDIQKSIREADLVLCEMSGKNPNVFYELGLAHAIGKPVILVSRKKDDIPFDLSHIRVIIYDSDKAGWEPKLRENISATARSIEKTDEVWPLPMIPTEDHRTLIGWQKSCNVFWLGHDLPWTINLINTGVGTDEVILVLNKSLHHLREIGHTGRYEEAKLSQLIEELSLLKSEFSQDMRNRCTYELRGIITRLGFIAESQQPDFRPDP